MSLISVYARWGYGPCYRQDFCTSASSPRETGSNRELSPPGVWLEPTGNQLELQPSAQRPVHFSAPKEARQEGAAHSNSAHGGSPTSDLPRACRGHCGKTWWKLILAQPRVFSLLLFGVPLTPSSLKVANTRCDFMWVICCLIFMKAFSQSGIEEK